MTPDWVEYAKFFAALVAVLGGAWAVTRYAVPALYARRNAGGGLIRVRASFALEPRKTVYLVEVGSRTLCVGSSEQSLSLLATFDSSELPPPEVR